MRFLLLPLSLVLISCSSSTPTASTAPSATTTASSTPPESTPPPAAAPAEPTDAKAYLDKAASQPGATRTASGLIYRELTPGKGASPKASDVVMVNYRGTLTDGTEFDSSYKRNEPATFPLNRVIPCWTEGVQKMKVGGKSQLICPAAIAYGDRGAPPAVPGGATLIFEVELLAIQGS